MKNSHKKAKRSNFLILAEMVHVAHADGLFASVIVSGREVYCSRWCCNSMAALLGDREQGAEQRVLIDYFYPKETVFAGGGWWASDDCESRIVALLLCAEMLRR